MAAAAFHLGNVGSNGITKRNYWGLSILNNVNFGFLRNFIAALVMSLTFPYMAIGEQRLSVVTNSGGVPAVALKGNMSREITTLPIGTSFIRQDLVSLDGKVTRFHYARVHGEPYIIADNGWTVCTPQDMRSDRKRNLIKIRQDCLLKKGLSVGQPDGVWGPKTNNAIDEVFSQFSIQRQSIPKLCQLELACKASLMSIGLNRPKFLEAARFASMSSEQKDLRSQAVRLLRDQRCEEAERIEENVTFGLDFEKCKEDRERWQLRLKAGEYFLAVQCEALAEIPVNLRGQYSLDECEQKRRTNEVSEKVRAALAKNDCETARQVAEGIAFFDGDIAACENRVKVSELERQLGDAMAENNCVEVGRIEQALSMSGGQVKCDFNVVMTGTSPREMFLGATRYDAGNDRARAKLVYARLMERFPEDDLALQAALRLTALNDLERSEEARREMEAKMARLKREAEDAQRKAEEARRQAERARAEAERRAAAATTRPVRSACSHVYRGKRVQIIPDAPNNAKQAIGLIFQGGLYGTNFEVTGVGRSEATLYSLDTGRSFQMPCSQVP